MLRLFPIALLTLAGFAAFGQQYPFLAVPGSPQRLHVLFEATQGRLWLGGRDPACFDGTRFFSLRDYGFPATEALDFSEDPSGAIWIGAESGVYRLANGRVEEIAKGVAVTIIATTPNLAVAAMGPLGQSRFGNTSLFRIQRAGERWIVERVMNLDSAGPLTLDSSGSLLYSLLGKGWEEIPLADVVNWRPGARIRPLLHPVQHYPDNVSVKVVRDHAGCVWFGSSGGDWFDCGNGNQPVLSGGLNGVSPIHESADGTMVVWGGNMLVIGRPGAFRSATRANGLPAPADAIRAKDGTIWLATPQGLVRFASPFRVEYWTIRDGVIDIPWSLARSGKRVYAGLGNGRIVALSENRTRWDLFANIPDHGDVTGLLPVEGGTLVAALSRGTIEVGSNGHVIAETSKEDLKAAMRVAKTPGGEIWLGSRGLGRLTRSGKVLSVESHPLQTVPSRNVLGIKYEEHSRKLWACYNGGLVVRDEHGVWREYTTRDGLLVNGCWSVAPLPNGDVWYGYFGIPANALIRTIDGGRITVRQYGLKDIPEPGGATLDADQRGWLWRAGERGDYVADASQAEAGQWLKLDQSDGFPPTR